MDYRDHIITSAKDTQNNLFVQVRAVPADKLSWKPEETARPAIDILAECCLSLGWVPMVLENRAFPDFTPELMAHFEAEKAKLDTIEKCQAKSDELMSVFEAAVRNFPETDLGVKISSPFGKPEWSVFDVMELHNWNATYHTGQICYIQTLLGDTAMHG